MLRRYPQVRQHEQTADVVQEPLLNLLAALRQLSVAPARAFHGLGQRLAGRFDCTRAVTFGNLGGR
jgi:hypothetical protein